MEKEALTIQVTEEELQQLQGGAQFNWFYTLANGTQLELNVMQGNDDDENDCLHNYNDGICKTCGAVE